MKTLRYELSGDKMGLIRHFETDNGFNHWYHVHSDEMTDYQKRLHKKLARKEKG